jgi:DNA-binding NarL/FixJ family response regulator
MKSPKTAVYVVEDSPIFRKILFELIVATGATVVGHADTASVAIAEIAALHPDVVTIDIALKAGNGFDVLEAIAISEGNPPVCIVLTNYATNAYRNALKELGADHVFDKAMQIKEVLAVLETVNKPNKDLGGAVAA